MFAYNTSRHESSKFSPFELMFGRRATLPIDIKLRKAGPEEMLKHLDAVPANEPDDFAGLQKERQKRLEEAKANILAAQEKQKDHYDRKRARPECYQVDALVLKKDFLRKKRKGGKLDHRYVGPYKILKILPKGTYLLQLVANSEVVVRVTGSHLKPYNEPADDAGNEPPLKKSRTESPAGNGKTNNLSSTSDDSLCCLSPAADHLKSPETKISSQTLSEIDSPGSPKACSTPNHLSSSLLHAGNTKQNAIDADKERKTKQKKIKPWIAELGLNEFDKRELVDGDWLTDKHINAVNTLLRKQHPTKAGLQDPVLLSEKQIWRSQSQDFVQVINICRNHWVCASNVNCSPGVVDVYDSLPACMTKAALAKLNEQIAAILHTSDRDFEVRLIDVQHQSGSSDCSLFAVAFAQVLCAGLDPHLTTFDQKSMREHLFSSFEDGELLPFPLAQRQRRLGRRRVVRKQKVPVYSSCRLPWNKKDNVRGPLVSCHICNEWFHQDCENIPDIVFDQADYVWLCHMCS